MTKKHPGIMPLLGLALLICLPSLLGAADEDAPEDGDPPTPTQLGSTHGRACNTGCGSRGEADSLTSETACVVDLKPGDLRLFAPSVSAPGKLHRWINLQAASVGIQYLYVKNGTGVTTANQLQYQVVARGRFKFDAKGRFGINAGLSTGTSFIAGFNNTGLGMGSARSNLSLKYLYFSGFPLDGVEIQYGGLDVWHDESTDITGYAYNGYIVGERLSMKRPRNFFFDDISVAYAYVGDFSMPNVIRRGYRLGQSNFHRFMLKKNIGERAWISADYAFQSGIPTWREAVRIRAGELRAIDTFHAEIYEISRPHSGYGFSAYAEKTVRPKFVVGGGYASIDRTLLNSDRYGRGNRLFLTTKIPINEAFSILMFATQATDHATTNMPQKRLDIGLYYNVLDLLRMTHLF